MLTGTRSRVTPDTLIHCNTVLSVIIIQLQLAADVICQFPLNIYLFRAEFLSTDRLLPVTVLVVILHKPKDKKPNVLKACRN